MSEGQALLDVAWFAAIDELVYVLYNGEDQSARQQAAEALLKYMISLGQSINLPHIPESRPKNEEVEDEQ